jgi:hypothetical protein
MASSFESRKNDLAFICCQHHTYRKELLKHIDSGLVKCICQCTSKILDGSLPTTPAERTKLRKHKKILRKLNRSDLSSSAKKGLIVQSGGGFLLSLIPAVVGALASLIR